MPSLLDTNPLLDTNRSDSAPDTLTIAHWLARGDWPALAEALSYPVCTLTLPPQAYATWGLPAELAQAATGLHLLAARPGFRLLLARGDAPWEAQAALVRRAMLAAHRHNPAELIVWWWVDAGSVTVATVDLDARGRPFVRRMTTDRLEPDPIGLQQWAGLSVADLASPDGVEYVGTLRRHVGAVLRQDGVTRQFFAGFTRALDRLCEAMEGGPAGEQDRHDVALATLLRLVFLYFLQVRGALDDDRRFVMRHLRAARAEGRSFYASVLRPLFFGALNRPEDRREPAARALGALPFLNGGLFEPLPVEREHANLDWPDAVWREVIDELLERYHFTIAMPEAGDEACAVDPEMLGKVFEGLMYGQSRVLSGSFYTPRDVVRAMVEDTLSAHVAEAAGLEQAAVRRLFDAGKDHGLSAAEVASVGRALAKVRILDPAVGTGAFLLEALHVLHRAWRALGPWEQEEDACSLLRRLIHDHLFGVDVQRTAVRLCELRLWLAILAAVAPGQARTMPPLPNLSHRVTVGNSLLSPLDLLSVRAGGEGPAGGAAWGGGGGEAVRTERERLGALQARYLTAHGDEKAALQADIEAASDAVLRAMIEGRLGALRARLEPLERLLEAHDLFGQPVAWTPAQRTGAEALREQIAALEAAAGDIGAARAQNLALCFEAAFGATGDGQEAGQGGFDIVLTNPPWVRAERIDAGLRGVLRARYGCCDGRLWPQAAHLGIEAHFGTQVDLAALFVERSLELLRPGGRLCALLPVKLFRSLYGASLRALLFDHRLVAIEDYSDAHRRMFDATTYPAVLHVQKAGGQKAGERAADDGRGGKVLTLDVWRGEQRSSWQTAPAALPAIGEHPGEPWLFVEPEVRQLFDRMWRRATPLGAVAGSAVTGELGEAGGALEPRRGVLTGLNEVFVVDEARARALCGDALERWSRPVLLGREVRAWEAAPTRRILWPYDEHLRLCDPDALPRALRRHFEAARSRLVARSDHRPGGPLWQLFRVNEAHVGHKVVWRDLSLELEAAAVDARTIVLNTVYFMACAGADDAHLLAGYLNSEPVRAVAYALGERARGGWRRHFSWVVRMLPVPPRLLALRERLAAGRAWPGDVPDVRDPAFAAWLFELDDDAIECLREWRLATLDAGVLWAAREVA